MHANFFAKTAYCIYNLQVESLLNKDLSDEECVNEITSIASNAWINYNGLLCDFRLEELLLSIGKKNIVENPIIREKDGNNKILHVATNVWAIGGHTRVILDWIINDNSSEHVLYLTNQDKLPEELIVDLKGIKIVFDSSQSKIEKAKKLNTFSREYDLIILYHHPNDVVPNIAFANPSSIPVVVYNHADHVFWLGTSIADCVVDIRNSNATSLLRNNSKTFTIPFLSKSPLNYEKEALKKELGIDPNSLVLLSMGAKYKFLPYNLNYIKNIIIPILKANNEIHYYLIGPDNVFVEKYITTNIPDNLIPLGYISNPEVYLKACDIYIESAPIGSGMASIDVLNYKAAPLFSKCFSIEIGKTNAVGAFPSGKIRSIVPNNKIEFRNTLTELIRDKSKRAYYVKLCEEALFEMSLNNWKERISLFYKSILKTSHNPQLIKSIVYNNDSNDFIKFTNSKKYVELFQNNPFFEFYLPLYSVPISIITLVKLNIWFIFSPKLYEHYQSLYILNKQYLKRVIKFIKT
ncbi:MAG: hypothetical protein KAS71_14235 [Bacteroidales bacterium]|nr:hypothetical protein [Bacteroidales bacterium]